MRGYTEIWFEKRPTFIARCFVGAVRTRQNECVKITFTTSIILTMSVTSPTKNVNHIPCCDLIGAAAHTSECNVCHQIQTLYSAHTNKRVKGLTPPDQFNYLVVCVIARLLMYINFIISAVIQLYHRAIYNDGWCQNPSKAQSRCPDRFFKKGLVK